MASPIWPIEGVALDSTGDLVADSLGDKVTDLLGAVNILVGVYPTAAVGATVTSGTGAWVESPAYWPVVPVSTITNPFHIHGICVETCTLAAGVFELSLYSGVGHTEVARCRFSVVGGFFGNVVDLVTGVRIAADSQIDAKLRCSVGTPDTLTISIRYAEEV
jgi:hypothetical protein